VQRGVEQADRHRQAVHRLEDPEEVGPLEGLELPQRGQLLLVLGGEDEALHDREPVAQEHVLGAAQPDALGAEPARLGGVVGQVGVGADPETPEAVGPLEDGLERPRRLGGHDGHRAQHHLAGRAVDGDDVALAHGRAVDREDLPLDVDVERRRATNGRLPHPAGDDGGVAHQPAA
jgi:hypothetical protein